MGNCIGLTSQDDKAEDMVMLPIFMPVEAGEPLINLETENDKTEKN